MQKNAWCIEITDIYQYRTYGICVSLSLSDHFSSRLPPLLCDWASRLPSNSGMLCCHVTIVAGHCDVIIEFPYSKERN